MQFPILTSILLAPIWGIIIILLLPETKKNEIKVTAAIVTFISLLLSIIAFVTYNKEMGGLQFQETYSWIPAFGINYSVGADGLSIPLVLLTAIVIFAGVFASWKMEKKNKGIFHISAFTSCRCFWGIHFKRFIFILRIF